MFVRHSDPRPPDFGPGPDPALPPPPQQPDAESLQLLAREAAADAAAYERCARFRLVLCSGALGKDLTKKAKHSGEGGGGAGMQVRMGGDGGLVLALAGGVRG